MTAGFHMLAPRGSQGSGDAGGGRLDPVNCQPTGLQLAIDRAQAGQADADGERGSHHDGLRSRGQRGPAKNARWDTDLSRVSDAGGPEPRGKKRCTKSQGTQTLGPRTVVILPCVLNP